MESTNIEEATTISTMETLDTQPKTYYERNKEKILAKYHKNKEERIRYQKEYNQLHNDKVQERNKEYYQKNKEKLLARAIANRESKLDILTAYFTCECGAKIQSAGKSAHLKSKKHITYLSKNV